VTGGVERGTSAVQRILHAMNTIYYVSSGHEIFGIVDESIKDIEAYLDKTLGCTFEGTFEDTSEYSD
jgi:hypothetical protein